MQSLVCGANTHHCGLVETSFKHIGCSGFTVVSGGTRSRWATKGVMKEGKGVGVGKRKIREQDRLNE